MKRLSIYGLVLVVGSLFCACSDDEENLKPSGIDDDYFAVPADATDPESVLRREFFEKTGVHLLFTDVLRTNTYTDEFGQTVGKDVTIDFDWNLNTEGSVYYYQWELMTDGDIELKRKTADLFIRDILPHIQGSRMAPFSVLLFKDLEIKEYSTDDWERGYTLPNWRCLGFNAGYWLDAADDDEIREASVSLCKALVSSKFNYRSDLADDWNDLSYDGGSGEDIVDWVDDWDRDITKVYELGFLDYDPDWRDRLKYDSLPYADDDFEMYFNAIFDRSREDFEAEFGQYAKIMEKYNMMYSLIEQTGYKF